MNTGGLLHSPDLVPDLMIRDLEVTVVEMENLHGREHATVRRLVAWLGKLRQARDEFFGTGT